MNGGSRLVTEVVGNNPGAHHSASSGAHRDAPRVSVTHDIDAQMTGAMRASVDRVSVTLRLASDIRKADRMASAKPAAVQS